MTDRFHLVSHTLPQQDGGVAQRLLSSSRNPARLPQFSPGTSSSRTAQVSVCRGLTCSSPADSPQPPRTPAKAPAGLLGPQPAQHSTCSAQRLPEVALEAHQVWERHSHLQKELRRQISRPVSCTSWRLGILPFRNIQPVLTSGKACGQQPLRGSRLQLLCSVPSGVSTTRPQHSCPESFPQTGAGGGGAGGWGN